MGARPVGPFWPIDGEWKRIGPPPAFSYPPSAACQCRVNGRTTCAASVPAPPSKPAEGNEPDEGDDDAQPEAPEDGDDDSNDDKETAKRDTSHCTKRYPVVARLKRALRFSAFRDRDTVRVHVVPPWPRPR